MWLKLKSEWLTSTSWLSLLLVSAEMMNTTRHPWFRLNTSRFKPPSFVAATLQIKYAFSVIAVKCIKEFS